MALRRCMQIPLRRLVQPCDKRLPETSLCSSKSRPGLKASRYRAMKKLVNVADFRASAKARLPKMVFDYLEGGAEDEIGLRHNQDAFRKIKFQPRRLVDVSSRDTRVNILGKPASAPF